MISVQFDDATFFKEMTNVLSYATGFIDGAQKGKPAMLRNISYKIKELLYSFIDSTARMEPQKLHHVYEWYQTGSPDARLYNLKCSSTGAGISISYTFSQSKSIRSGSNVPFYDKASIMEHGVPVTIRPVNAQALVFDDNGETVFTRKPVTVTEPGGRGVQNSFNETIKDFFNVYLSQTFLEVTGLRGQLQDMSEFNRGFAGAKTGGYYLGLTTGERWISKVGTIE